MRQTDRAQQVPSNLDDLEGIVRHVLGFGVPDALREVRVELEDAEIAIHFRYLPPEDASLIEEAQLIGTEVISHASAGMRISEYVGFADEPILSTVGRKVFDRSHEA